MTTTLKRKILQWGDMTKTLYFIPCKDYPQDYIWGIQQPLTTPMKSRPILIKTCPNVFETYKDKLETQYMQEEKNVVRDFRKGIWDPWTNTSLFMLLSNYNR